MKNKIYVLGIVATLLTSAGCFCKIMHWPMANILLITGLTLLALFFLPFAVKSSFKTEPDKKLKTLYILTAFVFAIDFIGTLFKIMHWPGANLLLIISLPLPFVVLLPVYVFSYKNENDINYKNFLAILFFFAYFAAISALLAINVSRNVLDGFTKSACVIEKNTKSIESYMKVSNTACSNNNINAIEIKFASSKLIQKIEILKNNMLSCFSGNGKQAANISLWEIKFKEAKPEINPEEYKQLKTEIDDFKAMLMKSGDSNFNAYLNTVLNTNFDENEQAFWFQKFYKNKILVSAIERLNLIQYQIKLAEYLALSKVK